MLHRLPLYFLFIISLLFAQAPANQNQQQQKEDPPGRIEGQVVNAITGEPLKKASLILSPMQQRGGDNTPSSAITDASGHFTMSNIAPGTYRLSAERTGFVRGDYGATGPMRGGTSITVSSGQEFKLSTFKLQPQAVIAGRITDEDGDPLANVQVQAMGHRYIQGKRQLNSMGYSSTNDLGEYRLFGLAPGRYYVVANLRSQFMAGTAVQASEPEEGYTTTYFPGTGDSGGAIQVAVAAGRSMSGMDMKMIRTRTARIRGRITNIAPQQSTRTMIMLVRRGTVGFDGDRNVTNARGKDGAFEIRGVAPGSYNLVAQYVVDDNRLVARVAVDVGSSNVDGVELAFKPTMEILGSVVMEGNNQDLNPARLNVFLQPKEYGPMSGGGSSQVKADGTFRLRNIAADTYRMVVFGFDDQVYVKSVKVGEQESSNGEVTVVDDAPPTLKVVLSAAGAQLSGKVTGEKQAPVQGATVVLIPAAEKRDQQQLFKTVTTDQDGKFSFKGIAPGEYKIFAWDTVEQGAWQDPDFLAPFENKGKSMSFKESDSSTADLEVLKNEDGKDAATGTSR